MSNRDEFIEKCGEIFMREFGKQYDREMEDPAYMAQEAFPDCRTRVACAIDIATGHVKDFAALCAINHREQEHGEDRSEEAEKLKTSLSDEDLEASVKWYW